MGYYSGWTADALIAEITLYRDAIKNAILGGEPQQVWGEGRRLVVTTVNIKEARAELGDLEAALARLPGYENRANWAIPVEIG
jgi:hypothetical protein